MFLLDVADNGVHRAVAFAFGTADTVIGDVQFEEFAAGAGGAFFVPDVSNVLIFEVAQSGEDGIGSSLTETAEGVGLDEHAELFELLDIINFTLTLGDSVEDLVHSSGTDTAGSTLTAGLINSEVEEELSDINHTVVLVHNDKTA